MNPGALLIGGVIALALVSRSASSPAAYDAPAAPPTPAPAGEFVDGWVNGVQSSIQVADVDEKGHQLRVDAAAAFIAMRAAAAAAGVALVLNSAYRTYAEQLRLFNLYLAGEGNLAAPPGHSNHEGGIAVDVESAEGTNAAFHWMTANAADYGFRRTVSPEPWHWEFA